MSTKYVQEIYYKYIMNDAKSIPELQKQLKDGIEFLDKLQADSDGLEFEFATNDGRLNFSTTDKKLAKKYNMYDPQL